MKKSVAKTRSKKRRKLKISGRLRSDQSLPQTTAHPLRKDLVTDEERRGLIESVLGRLVVRLEEADGEAGESEV